MKPSLTKVQLTAIVEGVAKHLPGWKRVPPPHEPMDHVEFIADNLGHKLAINSTWGQPGKLHISGKYPQDEKGSCYGRSVIPYNTQPPSINISWERSAEQIARDIVRRLMPEYFDVFDKATARKASADEYTARRTGTLARLAALSSYLQPYGQEKDQLHWHVEGFGYGDVKPSDETVEIHMRSVPADKAEAILRILFA